MSYISKRLSKATNKYLKRYDQKQDAKYIIYLNTNNLYGNSMPNFLPTSTLKWINTKEFNSNKYSSNSSKVVF